MLAKWEKFTGWFLEHTARWPRSARFTLCQRVQDHALEVVELLVVAHYEPRERKRRLHEASLLLERMRYLFRLARAAKVMPARGFETGCPDKKKRFSGEVVGSSHAITESGSFCPDTVRSDPNRGRPRLRVGGARGVALRAPPAPGSFAASLARSSSASTTRPPPRPRRVFGPAAHGPSSRRSRAPGTAVRSQW